MLFHESTAESWSARYGEAAPEGLPNLDSFLRHRSVRRFSDQPVDETTVRGLIGAAQSAATSSFTQCWSVVSVEDAEKRAQINDLCGGQKQILGAPWFFAFFADLHRGEVASRAAGHEPDALGTVESFVVSIIDAALAAERMVCAAEALGLGICYIGALRNDPAGVNALLGMPARTFGVFGLCLGWPDLSDERAIVKPRLPAETVWHRDWYRTELDLESYEAQMREFFPKIGVQTQESWAVRSGRRLSYGYLSGREGLKAWLEENGLNRE